MNEEKIYLKKLIKLSRHIQINFNKEELKDCKAFLDNFNKKSRKLNLKNKEKKNIKNKNINDYLATIWGKKWPFITLSSLKIASGHFRNFRLSIKAIKHNANMDEDNFILYIP